MQQISWTAETNEETNGYIYMTHKHTHTTRPILKLGNQELKRRDKDVVTKHILTGHLIILKRLNSIVLLSTNGCVFKCETHT